MDKKDATPRPIVIDRYYFKEDYTGYVRRKRSHLYLLTLGSDSLTQLTSGDYDELSPSWSPDGTHLAFSSKRIGPDPDRANDWNVYVMDAAASARATADHFHRPRRGTRWWWPGLESGWKDHRLPAGRSRLPHLLRRPPTGGSAG